MIAIVAGIDVGNARARIGKADGVARRAELRITISQVPAESWSFAERASTLLLPAPGECAWEVGCAKALRLEFGFAAIVEALLDIVRQTALLIRHLTAHTSACQSCGFSLTASVGRPDTAGRFKPNAFVCCREEDAFACVRRGAQRSLVAVLSDTICTKIRDLH